MMMIRRSISANDGATAGGLVGSQSVAGSQSARAGLSGLRKAELRNRKVLVQVGPTPYRALSLAGVLILVFGVVSPSSAYTRPGIVERISVSSQGEEAQVLHPGEEEAGDPNCYSWNNQPDISRDGRFVAFSSSSPNLVQGDTNEACDVFVRDRKTGQTERVSISSSGNQTGLGSGLLGTGLLGGGSFPSVGPSISASGRFVAFSSPAPNLVPGDTNLCERPTSPPSAGPCWDVFVRDRTTGETIRVSVNSNGGQYDGDSRHASISSDGYYVAFDSTAALDDASLPFPCGTPCIATFMHSTRTHKTTRVSIASDGSPSKGQFPAIASKGRFVYMDYVIGCQPVPPQKGYSSCVYDTREHESRAIPWPTERLTGDVISDNGRFVLFTSFSGEYQAVPNLGPLRSDVFVYDRLTARTERVSVTAAGEEPPEVRPNTSALSISPDGRYVAFGLKKNPFSEGGDPLLKAFVFDRETGVLESVSDSNTGERGTSCPTGGDEPFNAGSLSMEGRFVAFWSCSPNLVADDANETWDVFVRDRGSPLSVGELVHSGQARGFSLERIPDFAQTGIARIPDSGSDALPSKLGLGHDLIEARVVHRPLLNDMYVVLELGAMPSTPTLAAATAGALYGASFTIDGVSYEIRAASSGVDARGMTTADLGLFACASPELSCHKLVDLRGGFGTSGERITFSVPLDNLAVKNGSVMSDFKAFSALGTYLAGATKVLDTVGIR